MTLVAVLAIAGLALLPDFGPRVVSGGSGIQAYHGRIVSVGTVGPDDPIAAPRAKVVLLEGDRAGETVDALIEGPGGSQAVADYQPGDEVVVTVTLDQDGNPYTAVADQWRAPLLGGFLLIFAIAVVVVGGFRGVRALVSLGLTIALILKVLIPLVVGGVAPVPLAVATATVVTVVSILLTEGWSRVSAAAIVGTSGALALTGLLGAIATSLASFTYSAGSDLAFLQTSDGVGLDLRGMLLAAFILGAAGVLDDVTVTQAALIQSLADHGAHGRALVESALSVGRSHIAATVNTLFLAYVGAGLPLIVTIMVSRQPMALILNSEEVATEVVRTIVGSLGILAAVPFTTFVAAAVVDRTQARRADRPNLRRAALPGAIAAIVAALALTIVLPLGSPRRPLRQDTFGPSSIPAGARASASGELPGASDTPGAGSALPQIVSTGEPYVMLAGDTVVDVTVLSVRAVHGSGGWTVTITTRYDVEGPGSYDVDLAPWSLITVDGQDVPLEPAGSNGLVAGPIAEGHSLEGSLRATVSAPPDQTFVSFADPSGAAGFAIPADGG
jgi:uncharacterized membrane protein